jgi:integrase
MKEQAMKAPITPDSTVADLVDHWLQQIRVDGRLERTTINEYERVLRTLVVPELGHKRIDELTTEHVNELLAALGRQSLNGQRKAKVILGAMLDFAIAYGPLADNPVRGSLSISRSPAFHHLLSPGEVASVQAAVRAWLCKERPGPRSSGDMADVIEVMLASGARIGEVLALRWRDIDLHARTVEINGTIKTESGRGTYRKAISRPRTLELPEYTTLLLGRRRRTKPDNLLDAVFPTRNATWQQVNNVERRWRQIRQDAGLDWITPDLFRRVATGSPAHERRLGRRDA